MWLTISAIVLIVFLIYQLDRLNKRVLELEVARGPEYNDHFAVNVLDAVLSSKKFGEIAGIKSIVEGKEYEEWSKTDKDKWDKDFVKDIASKVRVHFTYLQAENAYIIKNRNENWITHRKYHTNLLYSETIISGKGGSLDFCLYERWINNELAEPNDKRKRQCVLTPCLVSRKGFLEKEDVTLLCDFPLFRTDLSDEKMEKLGFEVKRTGGDDLYNDDFGEVQPIWRRTEFHKNGAVIEFFD